jgi:hypothetical protein
MLTVFLILCLISAGDFCSKILIQPLLLLIMRGNRELRCMELCFPVDCLYEIHIKKNIYYELEKDHSSSYFIILTSYFLAFPISNLLPHTRSPPLLVKLTGDLVDVQYFKDDLPG